MLTISNRQMEVFDTDARRRFRRRLKDWLRQYALMPHPLDDEALLELIERAEPRAASYGLTSERDVAKWCLIALLANELFDQLPAVQTVLVNAGLGKPSARLDLLLRSFSRELDQEGTNRHV